MTCYLGSPDVDYAKAPRSLRGRRRGGSRSRRNSPALDRASGDRGRALYVLDVHTYRDGAGAASTWHPYSVADLRQRRSVMRRLVLSASLAALVLAAATPVAAQTATAAGRGRPRPGRRRLLAVPQPGAASGARRAGCMEAPRLQHGAARRPTDAARSRHRDPIPDHPFRSRPAASCRQADRLPGGAGKELVEARCAVCHDLERVTIVKRQPRDWETIVGNMYERWGMSAPDEVRTITSYLVAQFGRD